MLEGGEHFALRVQGDSMIEDHILNGDLVVIRRQQAADDGDVVVALLDDGTRLSNDSIVSRADSGSSRRTRS